MRIIPHARQVRRVPHTARMVVEERRAGEVPCACWPRWACYWCWAWLVGLRSDGVFIAGLLLAVSVAGLVEWLRPAQWSWVLCTAYLVIAVAVPSWCAFMPLIAYDTARLPALASTGARAGARTAASGRSPSVSRTAASRRSLADAMRRAPWLSAAARWIWVLPLMPAPVRPWHRPSPDAGDDAGRPAWIRSGPARASSGWCGARCCTRRQQGARILAGHSFAHRRHR